MGVTRMPWAPISFSLPIISQKRFWSRTVCTEHHSSSARGMMVGLFRPGSTSMISCRRALGAFMRTYFLSSASLTALKRKSICSRMARFSGGELLVADEQGLALHHHLHLAQVVAHQRRAAADDVEDAVGQSDARADLHGTRDDVYLGADAILVQERRRMSG